MSFEHAAFYDSVRGALRQALIEAGPLFLLTSLALFLALFPRHASAQEPGSAFALTLILSDAAIHSDEETTLTVVVVNGGEREISAVVSLYGPGLVFGAQPPEADSRTPKVEIGTISPFSSSEASVDVSFRPGEHEGDHPILGVATVSYLDADSTRRGGSVSSETTLMLVRPLADLLSLKLLTPSITLHPDETTTLTLVLTNGSDRAVSAVLTPSGSGFCFRSEGAECADAQEPFSLDLDVAPFDSQAAEFDVSFVRAADFGEHPFTVVGSVKPSGVPGGTLTPAALLSQDSTLVYERPFADQFSGVGGITIASLFFLLPAFLIFVGFRATSVYIDGGGFTWPEMDPKAAFGPAFTLLVGSILLTSLWELAGDRWDRFPGSGPQDLFTEPVALPLATGAALFVGITVASVWKAKALRDRWWHARNNYRGNEDLATYLERAFNPRRSAPTQYVQITGSDGATYTGLSLARLGDTIALGPELMFTSPDIFANGFDLKRKRDRSKLVERVRRDPPPLVDFRRAVQKNGGALAGYVELVTASSPPIVLDGTAGLIWHKTQDGNEAKDW